MPQQIELSAQADVPATIACRLVQSIAEIADTYATLAERRHAVLVALAELVQADCGTWAWGRGWPDVSSVAPVAVIDFGVNDQQRAALMQWGLDPETERTFRQPIRAMMGNERAATALRHDIFTAHEWEAMPFMRQQLLIGGWSSWLHSVRYSNNDTWSCYFLLRNAPLPEFERRDADIVHLVLAAVPWLHSTAEETLPPETFVGLTARQRTVMLMLLDGLPRKTIASRLRITEDTVGDHIKSIYTHFKVGSSGELAALFLRSR